MKSTLFRLFALGGALFAIWHYKENPVLTSVMFVIGVLIAFTAGADEILIYDDRIRIAGGSLWKALRGKNTHQYNELSNIKVTGTMGIANELKGDIVIALPGRSFPTRSRNQLTMTRLNGETITHELSIYRKEIDAALNKIPASFITLVTKE